MPGYEQEGWVSTQQYQDRPWNELVSFWTAYNRHLLHLMERAPEQRLQTPCRIGDGDPVTLQFLMTDYVIHLKHHLRQLLP
jgi:DinB superfamily